MDITLRRILRFSHRSKLDYVERYAVEPGAGLDEEHRPPSVIAMAAAAITRTGDSKTRKRAAATRLITGDRYLFVCGSGHLHYHATPRLRHPQGATLPRRLRTSI